MSELIKATAELERVRFDEIYLAEEAKRISFVVDEDPKIGYEVNRFVYLAVLPISWTMAVWAFLKTFFWATINLFTNGKRGFLSIWFSSIKNGKLLLRPRYSSLFFDRFVDPLQDIRYGAASWKALELIYHHPFGKDNSWRGKIADFWIGMMNAQAVRNRFRLIKKELRVVLSEIVSKKNSVRIFSVASGSAEAVISVVKEFQERGNKIEVVLLDLDKTALRYAEVIAERCGIVEQLSFIHASVKNIEEKVSGKFDVIEMLGFLDYQTSHKASKLIERLKEMLNPGGYFMTCNIMSNPERIFLRWVISWPMIYRTPFKISKILVASGFQAQNVRLVAEPHKIHCLAICKNNFNPQNT